MMGWARYAQLYKHFNMNSGEKRGERGAEVPTAILVSWWTNLKGEIPSCKKKRRLWRKVVRWWRIWSLPWEWVGQRVYEGLIIFLPSLQSLAFSPQTPRANPFALPRCRCQACSTSVPTSAPQS